MFVIIKPDAISRGLGTTILREIELLGRTEILTYRVKIITLVQANKLYAEHRDKDFYKPLCDYTTSGPSGIARFAGGFLDRIVVEKLRERYGLDFRRNSIHASRTWEDTLRESAIFD